MGPPRQLVTLEWEYMASFTKLFFPVPISGGTQWSKYRESVKLNFNNNVKTLTLTLISRKREQRQPLPQKRQQNLRYFKRFRHNRAQTQLT